MHIVTKGLFLLTLLFKLDILFLEIKNKKLNSFFPDVYNRGDKAIKGSFLIGGKMRQYELMLIISGGVAEDKTKEISTKLKKLLESLGGKILKQKELEKKRLAYRIYSQDFGYYSVINFSLEPEKLEDFESQLRLEEEILRHIIIFKGELAEAKITEEKEEKIEKPVAVQKPKKEKVKKPIPKPKKKVEKIKEAESKEAVLEEIPEEVGVKELEEIISAEKTPVEEIKEVKKEEKEEKEVSEEERMAELDEKLKKILEE